MSKNTYRGGKPQGVVRHNDSHKQTGKPHDRHHHTGDKNKLDNQDQREDSENKNLHKKQGTGTKSGSYKTQHQAKRHSAKSTEKPYAKSEFSKDKSNKFSEAAHKNNDIASARSQDEAKPSGRVRKNRGFLEQKAARHKNKSDKHASDPQKRNYNSAILRGNRHQTGRRTPIYGALDLGTNNCRLLLARPQRRGFRVVDSFSRIIRLGEGIGNSNRLSDEAMDRTIDALKVCSEKMAYRGVHRSRLIATEACRRAENGAEFIHRVHAETGLKLEIIEQETEAKLAVAGCAALLDERSNYALVFDIGGGSSELILVEISPEFDPTNSNEISKSPFHPNYRIVDWTSLPIGVVTLSEKFGGKDVTHGIMQDMMDFVDKFLAPFEAKHNITQKISTEKIHLLGTSGTVTTVAGIHLKLPQYDRRRIDGFWLESSLSIGISEKLIDMKFEGRSNQPCIGPERADLVLAGCAIFNAIYKRWPAERTRVADRGLREGILTNLMSGDLAQKNKTI